MKCFCSKDAACSSIQCIDAMSLLVHLQMQAEQSHIGMHSRPLLKDSVDGSKSGKLFHMVDALVLRSCILMGYLEWGAMFFFAFSFWCRPGFLVPFFLSCWSPGPPSPLVLLDLCSSWTSCPLLSRTTCPLASWSCSLLVIVSRSRSSTQVVAEHALLQVPNMATSMGTAGLEVQNIANSMQNTEVQIERTARVERCK